MAILAFGYRRGVWGAGVALVLGVACGNGGAESEHGGEAGNGATPGAGGTGSTSNGTGSTSNGTGSTGSGTGGVFVAPTCEAALSTEGFHATVDGTADGDGSLDAPWDIATALNDPSGVQPGDTIWVHGGTYEGTFVVKQDGNVEAPITIRAWPGERVTLDAAGDSSEPVVQIYRTSTILRDLEITNSGTDRRSSRGTGVYVGGDGISLVNLTIHDVGVGVSGGRLRSDDTQEGTDILVYGTLFYNNGWMSESRGSGHHSYLTNRDSVVTLEDNVLFHAYGFGVHNYSSGDGNYVRNMNLAGNVWFQNGAPGDKLYDGCMIGHDGTLTVSNVTLTENYGWAPTLGDRDVRLGWDTPNENATLTDNYFVGQTIFQDEWTGITMSGNRFIGSISGVDAADFPGNEYLDSAPTENHVVLRPNRFEPGRAHIIAYNWEDADTITVDPSEVLTEGAEYVVRTVQDYYGESVLSGTYEGGTLTIPVRDLSVVQPVGDASAIGEDELTGAAFNVFVLQGAVCDE